MSSLTEFREVPKCKLCGRPVVQNESRFDIYEQMHWLCFHIMFEHDGDPDVACNDPACVWNVIGLYEDKLKSLGCDPESVYDDSAKPDATPNWTQNRPRPSWTLRKG